VVVVRCYRRFVKGPSIHGECEESQWKIRRFSRVRFSCFPTNVSTGNDGDGPTRHVYYYYYYHHYLYYVTVIVIIIIIIILLLQSYNTSFVSRIWFPGLSCVIFHTFSASRLAINYNTFLSFSYFCKILL